MASLDPSMAISYVFISSLVIKEILYYNKLIITKTIWST